MFNQQQQAAIQSLYCQERLNEANQYRLINSAKAHQPTNKPTRKMLSRVGDGLVKLGNRLQSANTPPTVPPIFKKSAGRI